MVRKGKKVLVYILTLTMILFILPTPVLSAMTVNEELGLVIEEEYLIQELLAEGIIDEFGESEENEDQEDEDIYYEEDKNIIFNEEINGLGFAEAGLPVFMSENMTLMSNPTDETSLKEALDKAQAGATVTINSQFTISTHGQIVIKEGVTLKIINGAEITVDHNNTNGTGITVDGSLIIENGRLNIKNPSSNGVAINSTGYMSLKKGQVLINPSSGSPEGIKVEGGTLTVEDGLLVLQTSSANVSIRKNAELNITGGEVTSEGMSGLRVREDSVMNVSGGNVNIKNSSNRGLEIVGGKLNISGGIISLNNSGTGAGLHFEKSDLKITNGGSLIIRTSGGTSTPNGIDVRGISSFSILDGKLSVENTGGTGILLASDTVLTVNSGSIDIGNTDGRGIHFNNANSTLNLDASSNDVTLNLSNSKNQPVTGQRGKINGKSGIGNARIITGEFMPTGAVNTTLYDAIKDIEANTVYLWDENENLWQVDLNYTGPSPTAPDAPNNVSAEAGDGQATVKFDAPGKNGGAEITGYTVTSSPGGVTATGDKSPITVTGLTNDTAYTFTVTATNSVGTSAASSPSNSITPKSSESSSSPTPEINPSPEPEPIPVPDSSPTPSRRPASTPAADTTDTGASKIVDVIRDESAPDIQFDTNTETIFNTVFNDTELALINSGESARVFITINDISETVNETDITLVNQALATTILDDFTLGLYIDLKMFKQIGNNTAEQLFNLNNQLSITIEIPEELRAEGREFKLIRIHDGEAEIISGIYNHETGLFTFETDRFSTYALIYSDDEAIVRSPRTYDDSPLILVSNSNAISIVGIILLIALSLIAFGASGSLVISDLRRNKYLN